MFVRGCARPAGRLDGAFVCSLGGAGGAVPAGDSDEDGYFKDRRWALIVK